METPDQVGVHLPARCMVCGREMAADEPPEIVSRQQVFYLPELKLAVIISRFPYSREGR